MDKRTTKKSSYGVYIAWFVIVLFYSYQYILRVTPGVMVDNVRHAFKITAEQFATLGSLYLIAYSLLQIPLGVVVDYVGVKKVVLWSLVLCILGTLLFGMTTDFAIAQIARVIIGMGSASAFMCGLKFVADNLPIGQRGFLIGATLSMGTMGAMAAAKSVKLVEMSLPWRDVVIMSAFPGVLVLLLIWLCVRIKKNSRERNLTKHSIKQLLEPVKAICASRNIVLYTLIAIGLYAPLAALTDLWGTAFVKQKFALSQSEAASVAMMMYAGLTIGSLILPWLAERYNKINEAIILCSFCILVIFSVILYLPPVNKTTLIILFIMLGFFCSSEMMCFTGAINSWYPSQSGEVIGVVNTLNMLGGAIIQQVIGWGLDLQWAGLVNIYGVREYTTFQFEIALTTLILVILLCCGLSFMLTARSSKSTLSVGLS